MNFREIGFEHVKLLNCVCGPMGVFCELGDEYSISDSRNFFVELSNYQLLKKNLTLLNKSCSPIPFTCRYNRCREGLHNVKAQNLYSRGARFEFWSNYIL
jgi:hypothetical protein